MTREILFRGKRIDNKEWVEGYYVPIANSLHLIYTGKFEIKRGGIYLDQVPVFSETVGRFTGLTDKNGRKIFEGDIVICEGENCEVRFKHGTWLVEFINEEWDFLYTTSKQIEVISNVHDNPELLGGDNNA